MKKSLIALTVAGALANTALAVDLDDSKSTAKVVYASEIEIAGTGVEVTSAETAFSEIGFTVTDAAPRFFRYELTNDATFVGNPTLAIVPGMGSTTGPSIVQSSGGAGKDFVLFEVSTSGPGNMTNDSIATLTLATPGDNLGLAGSTTIKYTMFEFGASGGTGELASAGPRTFAEFVPATAVGTAAATGLAPGVSVEKTALIDVSLGSLLFESGATGTDTTTLGSIYIADAPFSAVDTNGAAAGIAAVVADSVLTVSGDFSAADEVFLSVASATGACAGGSLLDGDINDDADEVEFDTSNSTFGTTSLTATLSQQVDTVVNVCMTVTGEDPIPESSFTAMYEPTAKSGFTRADAELTLATLGNTGTTITLNLQLTPTTEGGVYKNYFRVTNTSGTTGRVFFRLINDEGESSASIDMEDVYGDSVNSIVGGGSSRQFDIDAVYAAVQAADPTFSVGDAPRRKLRTVVTGEFGSMDVQTYTVANDDTTFSTF